MNSAGSAWRLTDGMGNFSLVFLIACALYALSAVQPPGICAADQKQTVVAKVNDVRITEFELEQAIDEYVPSGSFHGGMGKKREEYRKPALDRLIERELLYQEAKRQGVKADDGDVDKRLEEVKKAFKTKKAFEKALKDSGMTLKEYKNILRKNELVQKLLKAEVEDKAKYSDKELEDYYNANKDKFVRPEGYKVRHILIKVAPTASDEEKGEKKQKAEEILKKVKAGEDFGELAYKNSDDDYRVKGGDLGWVHLGRLEPTIEEAVVGLKVGEATMVQTMYGYHIVKLEDKRPAEEMSFAESKDPLRKQLETKRQQELKESLIAALKGKAKIEIY